MRIACIGLLAALSVTACAQAQAPQVAAIADTEPDVTERVAAVLNQAAQGTLTAEPLTENARAALDAPQMEAMRTLLRDCANMGALELLARTTKGEERQYQYRAPCGGKPLLVEINFGKGARISHLRVRPG
ncbi:hypothetical protein [Massilia sp. CF038]|uniref:hypothetical protein n=1 Tax=Massilia sp. CF038 TaxID=1881045 RepID=UPI000911D275|nr:hypothetical protein [Massilia sp. CF038]SHG46586.1 hypothetical protein SAMN05428948_0606 [Massilia sp. CF038]